MKYEELRTAVFRRSLFSAAVVLVFLFFLTWQLNFYLAENLKNGVYLLLTPVLIAGALAFCRPRGRSEYRLLLAYMLWVVVTRVLNGDRALALEWRFVLDLALMLPFLLLGLTLDRGGRRRILNWLSVLLGLYFFALGALCLAAFYLHTEFYNPITGGVLAGVSTTTYFERANILDTNPNATAYWFFMPLSLMLYQFFACRHKLWRVPIVLSALVDWLVICLTFSRSVRLACALSFALLAALLCAMALKEKGRALRVLAVAAAFLLVLPLSYKACAWACRGVGLIARPAETPAAAAEALPEETLSRPAVYPAALAARPLSAEGEAPEKAAEQAETYADPRSTVFKGLDRLSSERLTVYRAVWQTLTEHPRILLFGSGADEGLALVNEHLTQPVAHCHNFLLQTLLLTGLPGFLLVLAFCVFLLAAALRLLFTPRAPTPLRVLTLPVLSSLLFGQLEAGFFNYTDARTLFFYLICGMMLGTYYDLFPPKKAE
jgi:O-antigen ligase